MSTHANPTYFRANIQAIAGIYDPGDIPTQMMDFFDPVFYNLINNIRNPLIFEVTSAISLPEVSYRFYNTTSLWWLIAMYNGLIYPTDVEPGNVLFIPKIEDVDAILAINKRATQANNAITSTVII